MTESAQWGLFSENYWFKKQALYWSKEVFSYKYIYEHELRTNKSIQTVQYLFQWWFKCIFLSQLILACLGKKKIVPLIFFTFTDSNLLAKSV